jgi:hypothetical protein
VEKLQLLNDSEERTRRINEVLEVHVDPHMDPNYESAEEMNDKKFGMYAFLFPETLMLKLREKFIINLVCYSNINLVV